MRALVVSHNLVGDGLYIHPTVAKFLKDNPGCELDLETDNNFIKPIYFGMGFNWRKVFHSREETKSDPLDGGVYDKVLSFRAGDAGAVASEKQCHLAEAYAMMNGVELDLPYVETPWGKFRAIKPYFDAITALANNRTGQPMSLDTAALAAAEIPDGYPEGLVIFSPFSASCTSQERDKVTRELLGKPPNKMLPEHKWLPLIEYFRSLGPVRIVGGRKEIPPESWKLTMEEQECLGLGIPETALLMSQAKLVVTVDNGMGHLAASQDANHVVLYPMVLSLGFIVPWGANYTVPIQIDPNEVREDDLYKYIYRAYRHLLLARECNDSEERSADVSRASERPV